MKKAVVLFSGGLDSTTCLAYAQSKQFDCHALSFRYGQKHHSELTAASKIAKKMGAKHLILDIPIHQYGGSALTDQQIDVPDYTGNDDIPITYVPARNTIFLSFALGVAESIGAADIFIGVSAIDYSGYPDCRPEFIHAFEKMANLATKAGVEEGLIHIHTPLVALSKAATIELGNQLGVDYSETVSCYQANELGQACGKCDSCILRKQGFADAGIKDPTLYL